MKREPGERTSVCSCYNVNPNRTSHRHRSNTPGHSTPETDDCVLLVSVPTEFSQSEHTVLSSYTGKMIGFWWTSMLLCTCHNTEIQWVFTWKKVNSFLVANTSSWSLFIRENNVYWTSSYLNYWYKTHAKVEVLLNEPNLKLFHSLTSVTMLTR